MLEHQLDRIIKHHIIKTFGYAISVGMHSGEEDSLAPNTCITFVTVSQLRSSGARSIAPTFMSVNMAVIEIWLMLDQRQSCDTVTKVVQRARIAIGSETER